jgi:hypothetical protein
MVDAFAAPGVGARIIPVRAFRARGINHDMVIETDRAHQPIDGAEEAWDQLGGRELVGDDDRRSRQPGEGSAYKIAVVLREEP